MKYKVNDSCIGCGLCEFFDWRSDFVDYSYSNYEQSYTLPDDVVKDQISAKVEDGILTVTMPKTHPPCVQIHRALVFRLYQGHGQAHPLISRIPLRQ